MEEMRTELYCGVGSSNKDYNVSLVKLEDGKWNIHIAYGKSGQAVNQSFKLKENVGYYEAATAYEKLIQAKVKKGYDIIHQE